MTQQQIIQIQQFLKLANIEIAHHKSIHDVGTIRTMHYAVGRVMGAYSMLADTCKEPDVHAKVQKLMDDFVDAQLI